MACVGTVRHDVLVPDADPLPALPRLPLRTVEDLVRCAAEIHSDRCSWMGHDSPRPCTCGVPKLLVKLAHGETPAGTGA